MDKLLHIVAAPRGDDSRTLKVTKEFLKTFKEKNPTCKIEELKLFEEKLPPLTLKVVTGKYVLLGGKDLEGELKKAWEDVIKYIDQFLSADGYLLSTPMWNYSIPYWLKQYIDVIVQPKYLFRYTAKGAEGMAKGKKMVVITSRGGDYSEGSASQALDFQEPYLRAIFGLCGLKDMTFVNAQPMDMGPELSEKALKIAKEQAVLAAERF